MKTVYNSLTFYDTIEKQERNRFNQTIPIHCPRHQLPPFIIMANGDAITGVDSVDLCSKYSTDHPDIGVAPVNYPGVEFDTLTVVGNAITSAINAAGTAYCKIDIDQNINTGEFIEVEFTLTLNSGVAPLIRLHNGGVAASDQVLATAGLNRICLQAQTDVSAVDVVFYVVGATNFSTDAIKIYRNNITGLFQAVPAIYTDATLGKYIEYKGTALLTPLPYGEWYLKISVDGYVYYSDYFSISNIYPNLIKSWVNTGYETFTTAGSKITSAVNNAATAFAITETFAVKTGEAIRLVFSLTVNSGAAPTVELYADNSKSNVENTAAGLNDITLTSTFTGNVFVLIYSAGNASYNTSEVLAFRSFSASFCKIKFLNGANLGELLYADSFYQEVWLEAILNHTSHETVQVGEEKDGIFIPEKITTKLNYSIVAYICHALYLALVRLPQHSTITITDEVGNTYSPQPGNISIEQPEWVDYNTVKAVIKFNNDSTSNFSWVK